MKEKWPLFTGIVLLITGIVLRVSTEMDYLPLVFILCGASFKIYYILDKKRKGEYRPGKELIALYTGLALFFTGLYIKNNGGPFHPAILMAPGIALKMSFIGMFIRKTRGARVKA